MATFQIIEQHSIMPPDVLGVWQAANASATAFSASSETRRDIPQWHIDMAQDPQRVANEFVQLQSSLRATDDALKLSQARLQDFVRVQQTIPTNYHAAAFATAPQPEAELNHMLLGAASGVAFGITDQLGEWKQAMDEFVAFAQQIQQHVLHYALVDTRVEQTRVGITRVTWGGDFETVMASDAAQNQWLHQAALRATLLSRQQLLKQFATVIHGAGQLAGLALIATNPILALPAALRFLKLMFAEIRQAQTAAQAN